MFFKELDNESRRRLIDIKQRGEALRNARIERRKRFPDYMIWKSRNGVDYLYRRNNKRIEKSLGPRSPQTELTYAAYSQGQDRVKQRERDLKNVLQDMARVNRAMNLGRVPRLVARILRGLDDVGIMGTQVCVVGINALFAYEAHAGIQFVSSLLETSDIALDSRRNLSLTASRMPNGFLEFLRKIDPTFATIADGYFRAENSTGFMVDLITPEAKNRMLSISDTERRLGGNRSLADLQAAGIERLEIIVDAPRFSSIAVADDGLPVWISAADPRWFAAHKMWLSQQPGREAIKRQRDRDQGHAVASMLANAWEIVDLTDAALASIPTGLRQSLRNVIEAEKVEAAPEW